MHDFPLMQFVLSREILGFGAFSPELAERAIGDPAGAFEAPRRSRRRPSAPRHRMSQSTDPRPHYAQPSLHRSTVGVVSRASPHDSMTGMTTRTPKRGLQVQPKPKPTDRGPQLGVPGQVYDSFGFEK